MQLIITTTGFPQVISYCAAPDDCCHGPDRCNSGSMRKVKLSLRPSRSWICRSLCAAADESSLPCVPGKTPLRPFTDQRGCQLITARQVCHNDCIFWVHHVTGAWYSRLAALNIMTAITITNSALSNKMRTPAASLPTLL